jgi:hypothetical protein
MKIDGTSFGSITIGGRTCDHDVVVRLGAEVVKRKKKLSKRHYGASHTVSEDEARYLREKGCKVVAAPTPEAVEIYTICKKPKIGLFHITC